MFLKLKRNFAQRSQELQSRYYAKELCRAEAQRTVFALGRRAAHSAIARALSAFYRLRFLFVGADGGLIPKISIISRARTIWVEPWVNRVSCEPAVRCAHLLSRRLSCSPFFLHRIYF